MDLSTRYMGLPLRNPLVASASPLSQTVDGVRRLADAGVGDDAHAGAPARSRSRLLCRAASAATAPASAVRSSPPKTSYVSA